MKLKYSYNPRSYGREFSNRVEKPENFRTSTAVPFPPPPRANPRALAFFFLKWANSPGWGHISCVNAPGCGRRKRANAPPQGSSPSNRRLYSQATLSVKNQDILNDLSSHFTLARSVLKIPSFEFATLQCFI